jgi:hypothetical protein
LEEQRSFCGALNEGHGHAILAVYHTFNAIDPAS